MPLIISVWDDGYGISVPTELQTTKGSISAVLRGFERTDGGGGYDLYTVKGHDYLACCDVYQLAVERARREHVPAVVHVTEMTQPQGHSTSGSHERYKSKERLRFETEFDPVRRMRQWLLREELADAPAEQGLLWLAQGLIEATCDDLDATTRSFEQAIDALAASSMHREAAAVCLECSQLLREAGRSEQAAETAKRAAQLSENADLKVAGQAR